MEIKVDGTVCVSLDLKKFRIRVYKQVLHQLGNPEHIQLMVNPRDRVLAIECGNREDHLCHHINWATLEGKASYEIYSRNLLMNLISVCPQLKEGNSYKVKGNIKPGSKVAEFKISECTTINSLDAG